MTFPLAPVSPEEAERLCLSEEYTPLRVTTVWYPWALYLHQDQRYLGRCYAWLESRHVDLHSFGSLNAQERGVFFELLRAYEKAVTALWDPALINCAWLGNEIESHRGHGHMHFIPRYAVAPSWNGRTFEDRQFGRNYAPYKKRRLSAPELSRLRQTLEDEIKKHVTV